MKAHRVTILIACICLVSVLTADAFAITRPDRSRPQALLASPQVDSSMVQDWAEYAIWDGAFFRDTLALEHEYTTSDQRTTTTFYGAAGIGLYGTERHLFEYDDQGRQISRTELERNGTWQDIRRLLFHYSAGGLLEDSVLEYKSGPSWQEFTSWHYAYDAQDRLIEHEYKWFGTSQYRDLFAYDGNGNMTERIGQFDTTGTAAWINLDRDSLFYDGDHNNTQRIEYIWDTTGAWAPVMNYTFAYDAHNNLTDEWWQYEAEGSWVDSWHFQWTYDAHDNRITYWERHWYGSRWDNIWRDSSSYDGQHRIDVNIGEVWDFGHNEWLQYDRHEYWWDTPGYHRGTLSQLWESDAWVNDARLLLDYALLTSAPTDVGSDVQVDVDPAITLTFDSVAAGGHTAAVVSERAPLFDDDAFRILPPWGPTWYYVTTDAEYEGSIGLCIHYDQGILTQAQEDSMVMLHYQGTSVRDITTFKDTDSNIICGMTDSLSPFALALPAQSVGIADDRTALPREFALKPNYPNPFNPSTVIAFELPRSSAVEISIYNVLGQKVRSLVTGERAAGRHSVTWDGRDNAGRAVPSGMYFYRIEAGEFVEARKMLLLK